MDDWHIVLLIGGLLGLALLAGGLAGFARLPRVTAYLVVGILLGPSGLQWVDHEHIDLLQPLTRLAIALVLFSLGCQFPLWRTRRTLRRVLRLSRGELVVTFGFVFLGVLVLKGNWQVALLLGTLALATAPATTILVLKEMESEGPVTNFTNSLVALNNLASILLFELLFLTIHLFQGTLLSPLAEFGQLLRDLVGSVVLGVTGGLAAGFAYGLVAPSRRLILLVAIIMLILGVCHVQGMPYLLTFLAMGVTVANSTDQRREVMAELDRLTGLLCVVFFVAHGAELEVKKLGEAGIVGVGYVVLRLAGKWLGVRWAAQAGREEPAVQNWVGATLVAQAGAAIALSAIAVHRTAPLGGRLHLLCQDVQTVILGTVVVFEIVGPILIRQAVLRSGEVPLAQAIRHRTTGVGDQIRTLSNRLLMAAGYDPWLKRPPQELSVGELMRRNVKAVSQAATFAEVVEVIEQSRDNTYPVAGPSGQLVGVIRYHELSTVLFDPTLGTMVRADDITTPAGGVLHPDQAAVRAYELFRASQDDCLPVVSRDPPGQLIGVVRRRDLLRILLRGQMEPAGSETGKQ